MSRWSRRQVLKQLGASGIAVAVPSARSVSAQGVRVRRRVTDPQAANDLKLYARAVELMKGLDRTPSDRRGWRAQATIHNNHCNHANWFFLPWHRAYLYYFEDICRGLLAENRVAGADDFALPYWDWSETPAIPDPFWMGTLNHPRRIGQGTAIGPEFVGKTVVDNILNISDFQTFGSGQLKCASCCAGTAGTDASAMGQLEATPHNNVHRLIGRDMGSYMSPVDPIFWLHHCNIDRLWVVWRTRHPQAPMGDSDWAACGFASMFFDRRGQPAEVLTPGGMIDTQSMKSPYRYDTQAPTPETTPAPPGNVRIIAEGSGAEPVAPGAWRVRAAPQKEGRERLRDAIAPRAGSTIRLRLGGVTIGPETFLRVFVNHERPTADTPPTDQRYAGSIAAMHGHNERKLDFLLDITPALERVTRSAGDVPDKFDVQVIDVEAARRRDIGAGPVVQSVEIAAVGPG